jgi:hypothetical protein
VTDSGGVRANVFADENICVKVSPPRARLT